MAETARQPDVERRINEHLKAVDSALASKGVPLTERRSITADVEAQIRDMLAARAGDNPTSADVEAILRKIDAPESFAERPRRVIRITCEKCGIVLQAGDISSRSGVKCSACAAIADVPAGASAPPQIPSASASVQQPAPAKMRRKALLIAGTVAGLGIAFLSVALTLHRRSETFDARRGQTVGVSLFYGESWQGLLPRLENLGFTVNFHDGPLDKKFLSEIGILTIFGCGQDGQFSKEEVERVSDFVASGGGLLCASQAWSWVSTANRNRTTEKFPINALGHRMGFVITAKNVGRPDSLTADTAVFGKIKEWPPTRDWWPSEVQPLTSDVTVILRDPDQHPLVLLGKYGAGRFVVAGDAWILEDNPEAFKAVLRLLKPKCGEE